MLAIGRVYDERLEFFGINLSIILSVSFLLLSIPLLLSIKRVQEICALASRTRNCRQDLLPYERFN